MFLYAADDLKEKQFITNDKSDRQDQLPGEKYKQS